MPPVLAMRRALDVIGSVIGLVLLSPLLALIAAAIKLEGGGPVLYAQLRVGKDFRPFRFCKFRSMVPGADRAGLLTAPNDVRLTRVGRILRKYKLDELPQLFNVLKGDMQLVGPRPEVERYVAMFRPQYARLLRDRPGITDPATLAYRREEQILVAGSRERQYITRILPNKLKLSLEYQTSRSLFSDFSIVVRTVLNLGTVPRTSEDIPLGESSRTEV